MATKRIRDMLSHFAPHPGSKPAAAAAAAAPAPGRLPIPTFDELPAFHDLPGCAWTVWGEKDQLGTVNLLTDEVVRRAAGEEIVTGKAVSLNWPLNFPEKPMFGRKSPVVTMKHREAKYVVRDDEIHINTQSGTQWDGLRHFGILEHGVFYNNTPGESLPMGIVPMPNPQDIDPSLKNIGIQNWAEHGICGRGVLLDLVRYHTKGGRKLPYDPWATHAITVAELEACAKEEGVVFRQGDVLLIRVGFIQRYTAATQEERDALAGRPETFAGIEQSDDMKRFLWWRVVSLAKTVVHPFPSPDPFSLASSPGATMSRRESRVSINIRQNDALFEFENFKKKFLLANKHITKLNSTLSVRIEELNAQISSLYVENLRLRASEIALAAQLKREREKSRKIMAEAEAATLNLTKHLGYIRQSFNITSAAPTPVASPPSPRARKPPSNPNPSPSSPQANRIARPPNVPGIYEDDEPCPSTASDQELDKPPSPVLRKTRNKPRLSASRLPLPSRVPSPPPPPSSLPQGSGSSHVELESAPSTRTRKPSRRQSGLLSVNTDLLSVPRAGSPAFGSPIRMEAGIEAEEEEEIATVTGRLTLVEVFEDVDVEAKPPPKKERRKSRGKERESGEDRDLGAEGSQPRERKRTKERVEEDTDGGGKPRLKDVTNSRAALIPIDNTVRDQADPYASSGRTFLEPSPTTSAPPSRSSSSPVPPGEGEGSTGGRERRTRKSVNYAEPKLNTNPALTMPPPKKNQFPTYRKMRKPDPPPGTAPTKKRASAAAVLSTYRPPDDIGNDADNDTEARSSLELPLRVNGTAINPESFPLPPSRPSSAASTLFSPPPVARTSSSSSSSSSSAAATSVRRKKSRPQMVLDDEESDGTQADAEYGVGSGGSKGWVNVEGRRRAAAGGGKRSLVVLDDERRHSMAV
ncbi:hypothetical protein D9615_002095 [Tricholomella constricta]|uniref:Shugoshin C-terminal domain-containing protein n=1 Tax=Tricholomella constricta TaxID=117010 RepID=A0A8H5HPP9_9AGAR|nr:hypothetical protein D9615_002095 [Tricholomella constricta]